MKLLCGRDRTAVLLFVAIDGSNCVGDFPFSRMALSDALLLNNNN